jgi:hypothetical protein
VSNGSGCRSGRPKNIPYGSSGSGSVTLVKTSKQTSLPPPSLLHLEIYYREEERAATAQYLRMLADLVMFRVRAVYKAETLEERPPWMAPRPLARLRYQLPTTAEKLAQLVRKQVSEKLEFFPLFMTSNGFVIHPYFQNSNIHVYSFFLKFNCFIFLKKGAHTL